MTDDCPYTPAELRFIDGMTALLERAHQDGVTNPQIVCIFSMTMGMLMRDCPEDLFKPFKEMIFNEISIMRQNAVAAKKRTIQ